MDKLTDLIINEVGRRALEDIPDIFARGWYLPLQDAENIDEVRDAIKAVLSEERVKELQKRVNEIYGEKCHVQPAHRGTLLASRIPGHDLSNLWAPFGTQTGALSDQRYWNSLTPERKLESAGFTLKVLVPYRAFCLAMAYLASDGDERFVWKIPVQQLPYCTPAKHAGIEWGEGNSPLFEISSMIGSPEYVALCQILKNAPTRVRASRRLSGYGGVLRAKDFGEGIRDAEGRPLPPERLGEIFGDFTTKRDGGGLGLQVAKELVHLRKGFIAMATTTRGEQGYHTCGYNTDSNHGEAFPPEDKTGTTFLICTPRLY